MNWARYSTAPEANACAATATGESAAASPDVGTARVTGGRPGDVTCAREEKVSRRKSKKEGRKTVLPHLDDDGVSGAGHSLWQHGGTAAAIRVDGDRAVAPRARAVDRNLHRKRDVLQATHVEQARCCPTCTRQRAMPPNVATTSPLGCS